MAVHIPPSLYTGGAVVLDSSPALQFYSQHLARKQAKQDAIDEYYRKLPLTINEAGVRDQERKPIDEKRNELAKYWQDHRDDIIKNRDNGAARFNYEKMVREMKSYIDDSKQRGKTGLEVGKMKFDPNKQYIFDDDDIVGAIDAHERPIGTEGSKGIDLAALAVPPKPFEQDKYLMQYGDIKMSDKEPIVRKNATDMTITTVKESAFDPSALKAIYTRAASDFANNKSFKRHVEKNIDKPENMAELNKIFKSSYGKEIENYDDMAAAYTIQGLQPSITKQTVTPDTFARQKMMEAIRQGNRKEMASVRYSYQQLKEDQKENRLNVILEGYIQDAGNTPGGEITINPVFKKELSDIDGYGDKVLPEKIRIVGEKVEYEYPGGKKGSISLQDFKGTMRKVMNQPVTPEDAAGPTVPNKPKTGQSSSYTIKGKKYSLSELKKMGYTEDQIAPYRDK